MEQYIKKSALVAEIENRIKKYTLLQQTPEMSDLQEELQNKIDCLNSIKGYILNTLEVKDPYEQCVQYDSIGAGIKAHAETYSFNIESELFHQLTKEQQELWRKEIEQACISGGNAGIELARDSRYKESLEVKGVDLDKEIDNIWNPRFNLGWDENSLLEMNHEGFTAIAKHFFELGLKAQHDNWKVVDNINHPQVDRNKIYCVFTEDRHILATVINHPKDEELLQWKCTEFPHHRYDMCEGDKYMQIV